MEGNCSRPREMGEWSDRSKDSNRVLNTIEEEEDNNKWAIIINIKISQNLENLQIIL